MKYTSDMLIGAGLTLTLIITVVMPAFGVTTDYGKLQDAIAIGLVGFMGKAALTKDDKKEEKHDNGNT